MRIAMISTPFLPVPPPRYGGTELIVAALTEGLMARGHDVVLYATGDSTVGAEVRSCFPSPVWPPDPYCELAHVCHAMRDLLSGPGRVDVIHAHSAQALAYAHLLEVPVIYTVHHERVEPMAQLYRATRADTVRMVCISERQRALSADVFDAAVVHHGLDTSCYHPGAGRGGYAAFLGRFALEKGPHAAIDVARAAGVPLRLAGLPHWKDELYFRTEVEPRLAQPGVEWLGELSIDPKVRLLGDAFVTLFPIAWEEPFGLVMIESMLCGTPVIALPRGAAPEVIDPGVTGWVVDDAAEMTALVRALHSGEIRVDREACRRRAAARFHRDRMVDDYLALYEESLALRSSPVLVEA